jgi:hypothetical protein
VPNSWIDVVDRTEGLVAAYGSQLPTLDRVELVALTLSQDSTPLTLRFDLADYPSEPPRRWALKKANTVQLELALFPLETISLSRWGTLGIADISLTRSENFILRARGGELDLSATSKFAAVLSIPAYVNSQRTGAGQPGSDSPG